MKNYLLQLDLAADFLDLLLQSLGILLGQTLLHGGGSALDGSLGLGQTQTHDLTDDLDDLDLLSGIEAGQNDVEVGLSFSSSSTVTRKMVTLTTKAFRLEMDARGSSDIAAARAVSSRL